MKSQLVAGKNYLVAGVVPWHTVGGGLCAVGPNLVAVVAVLVLVGCIIVLVVVVTASVVVVPAAHALEGGELGRVVGNIIQDVVVEANVLRGRLDDRGRFTVSAGNTRWWPHATSYVGILQFFDILLLQESWSLLHLETQNHRQKTHRTSSVSCHPIHCLLFMSPIDADIVP